MSPQKDNSLICLKEAYHAQICQEKSINLVMLVMTIVY